MSYGRLSWTFWPTEPRPPSNRTKQSRAAWIDATFELGNALAEAKKLLPANQDFSHWLKKSGLTLSADERAALIYIAKHADAAREMFEEKPELWSWRLIWSELSRLRSLRTQTMPPVPAGHGVVSCSEGQTESQRAAVITTAKQTDLARACITTAVETPRALMLVSRIGSLLDIIDWRAFGEVAKYRDELPPPVDIRNLASWLERLAQALE